MKSPRQWRNTNKDAPTRRKQSTAEAKPRSERLFPVVAVVVVFGSLLGTVVVQTMIVQNRVAFDSVTRDLAELREENQNLRFQVIELEAPERILDAATETLFMVRPDERRYLPGVDPVTTAISQPEELDPFGPVALPKWLAEEVRS